MASGVIPSPTQSTSHSSTTRTFNSTLEPPPADARWIEIPKTDGHRDKWPVFTSERDKDGNINFFRPVHIDERSAVDWRKKVGKHLAELSNLPSMVHLDNLPRYSKPPEMTHIPPRSREILLEELARGLPTLYPEQATTKRGNTP